MRTISTEELHAIYEDPKGTILDVRGPAEFAGGHIAGAVNIPHTELSARLAEVPKDAPVYVHCKMGGRAQKAAAMLDTAGFDVVCIAPGGMHEWGERDFPTT